MNPVAAYDRFLGLLAAVVGVMVLASMVFVVVDVLLRYFFGAPIGWVIEVCEYFLLFTRSSAWRGWCARPRAISASTCWSRCSAPAPRRFSTAGVRS